MTKPFYAEPILNSPYEVLTRHHALSESGEPLDHPPIEGRRRSKHIAPVPKSRRTKGDGKRQASLNLDQAGKGGSRYNPTPIINEIRTPGVNNLKTYGRWAFKELRDAFAMEEEYKKLFNELSGGDVRV